MTEARQRHAQENNDPCIHDIYKPKGDGKHSLKATVRSIMMLMPKSKIKTDPADITHPLGNNNARKLSVENKPTTTTPKLQSKFPVRRVVTTNMMKNSAGKDLLAVTVAAKILYKRESNRRQSILNNKSIAVASFLNSIKPITDEFKRIKYERMNTVECSDIKGEKEEEDEEKEEEIEELEPDDHPCSPNSELPPIHSPKVVPNRTAQGLVVDLVPHSSPDDLYLSDDLDLGNYTNRTNSSEGIEEAKRRILRKDNSTSVGSLLDERGGVRAPSKKKIRPTIRLDSRDAWKYQLDDEYSDSSDSCHSIITPLQYGMKPKSGRSGRQWRDVAFLDDDSGGVSLSDFLGQFDHDERELGKGHDFNDTDERSIRSRASSSSTISTSSTYSLLKRLHSQGPDCNPIPPKPTSSLEKSYAMKAHLKMVADQLTESLGIYPVPIQERPATQLYHKDGKARRVMSREFTPRDDRPASSTSYNSTDNISRPKSCAHSTPSPHSSCIGSPPWLTKKFPEISNSPKKSPKDMKPLPSPSLFRKPIGSVKRSSTINDSDIEDESVSSNDKKSGFPRHVGKKYLDFETKDDRDNVFLQENAVQDTFSWIKDMPRYLRDTGNIKPETLRSMNKSVRLGCFLVDEAVESKEF